MSADASAALHRYLRRSTRSSAIGAARYAEDRAGLVGPETVASTSISCCEGRHRVVQVVRPSSSRPQPVGPSSARGLVGLARGSIAAASGPEVLEAPSALPRDQQPGLDVPTGVATSHVQVAQLHRRPSVRGAGHASPPPNDETYARAWAPITRHPRPLASPPPSDPFRLRRFVDAAGRCRRAGAERARAGRSAPLDLVRVPAAGRPRGQRDGAGVRHRVARRGGRLPPPPAAGAAPGRVRRGGGRGRGRGTDRRGRRRSRRGQAPFVADPLRRGRPDVGVFRDALGQCFGGRPDQRTLELLAARGPTRSA